MVQAIVAIAILGLILCLSEVAWRIFKIKGELARKLVHITAGTFIAFLPFWVAYEWIAVIGLLFVAARVLNHYVKMFSVVHAVKRLSWGDILMGLAVTFCAILTPEKWYFAAGILTVALADGLAAIVGVSFAKHRGSYKILGHEKTVAGTVTFMIITAAILTLTMFMQPTIADPVGQWPLVVMLTLLLTAIENIGLFGFDNLLLPLVTVWILSRL